MLTSNSELHFVMPKHAVISTCTWVEIVVDLSRLGLLKVLLLLGCVLRFIVSLLA